MKYIQIEDKTRFLALYQDTRLTIAEIAATIDRSLDTVLTWVKKTKQGEDIRNPPQRKRKRIKMTQEIQENILREARKSPERSTTRKLAAKYQVGKSSVQRLFKERGWKYTINTFVKEHTLEEKEERINFCEKMLSNTSIGPSLLTKWGSSSPKLTRKKYGSLL